MPNRYNPLSPPRVVAFRRRGIGQSTDGTLDVGTLTVTPLDSAAQALLSDLNSSGCQQTAQTDVSDFQAQWNAAGSSPQLSVDGLYGNDTAAALQSWVSQDQASQNTGVTTAPAGCVASAPSSNSSSGASFTPGQSTSGVSSALASVEADLAVVPWWLWAGGAALAAYGIWEAEKHKKKSRRLGRHHARHLRRHRRH